MQEPRRLIGDALVVHVIFRAEIANQCAMAELAASHLDQALADGKATPVWAAVQGILVAAASISRVFWGSSASPEQIEQRAPLRALARVTDQSPLRPRKVRNSFEHFDERVEAWVAKGGSQRFSSRRVGSNDDKYQDQSYFGHLEPESGVVTFGDESISLRDLMAEISRIKPLVQIP